MKDSIHRLYRCCANLSKSADKLKIENGLFWKNGFVKREIEPIMPFFTAYVMAVFKMNELSDELIHCPAYLHFLFSVIPLFLAVYCQYLLRLSFASELQSDERDNTL
ncbi:MAG: hypothetical protein GX946_10580 [Oligosphaeraceae bacterium]|nr:hypothetical protein [Oligosphaeraceae bacterium]